MKETRFTDIELSKEIQKAIADLGFEEPTPIQSEAIPVMLEGKDIIGQAHTGTGKTAAFGIPILEFVDPADKSLQALIMCPTRELAIQVSEDVIKFGKYKKDISILPVYGGQSIDRQLKALSKGVRIVIGTPGRILDHLERGTIDLSKVKIVVLDEADEMLNMGFREDIELILKNTPKKRQTVMFSATMPKAILELTKKYQKDPVTIKVIHEKFSIPKIEQIYFEVKEKKKLDALTSILDFYNLKLSLIFCNTKKGVDELVEHLNARGYSADGMHSDMRQQVREKVINKFKKGTLEILVATDVAARGLDVDDVGAVFNYDMPQDIDYYVHRIGRTGRAGKSGKAFSFATGRDIYKIKDVMRLTKAKIKLANVPSFDDVEEMKMNLFIDEIRDVMAKGDLKEYTHLVEKLVDDDYTSIDVAAALLKMKISAATKQTDRRREASSVDSGDDRRSISGDQTRIFINVGKKDNARPGDILGAIAGETGLPGKIVGEIDMYDKYCFVNVPSEYVEQIKDALIGIKIKGRKVNVEEANKR